MDTCHLSLLNYHFQGEDRGAPKVNTFESRKFREGCKQRFPNQNPSLPIHIKTIKYKITNKSYEDSVLKHYKTILYKIMTSSIKASSQQDGCESRTLNKLLLGCNWEPFYQLYVALRCETFVLVNKIITNKYFSSIFSRRGYKTLVFLSKQNLGLFLLGL